MKEREERLALAQFMREHGKEEPSLVAVKARYAESSTVSVR